MKKLLKYFLTLGAAALTFTACEEEASIPELPANYSILADASFKDYKANVKITADKAASEDIDVEIRLDITSTFTADQLSFPASVKVAKGETEASATVEIKEPNKLDPGDYKAIFGAVVLGHGPVTEKVTITFTKGDLNGNWSVIGTINGDNWETDFAMAEGSDGWYDAQGIEAIQTAEFKFRKDGKWDVAFGLVEKGNAPLDKEFEVTDAPGGPNIGLESGIYTLSVNPNHKLAKVVRTGDIVYTYGFSAPQTFDENLKAVIKVTCDRPVLDNTDITIALDTEKSNFPENALTVPAKVTIAKGAKEATAEVVLNPEGLTPGGEYSAVLNATLGNDAVGTATIGYTVPIKVYTLAELVALMPATNKEKAEFKGILNDVLVTYVSGSNIFLEDATSAMLLYKSNTGLQAGVTLSGYFEGKVQNFNGLPEISDLSFKQEDITLGQAEVPAPAEMTIAQVNANFNSLISKRVKLTNAYAGADIQKKGEYSLFQGEDNIIFYTNVNLEKGFKKGSILDVVAIVTPYNDKKQVKIFEEAAITRLIPVMTMSDIQALCTSTTSASFAGVFEGLYVNYILGTDHMYLEDASGALRYYKSGGAGLHVGDKISGVITGMCQKGSDGRPVINWLDRTYATVTAAPADEQPKPVTGTLASFTDVAGLMYRRVKLENVVLEATTPTDKSTFITTISDETGTFPLHVRFKPSQALPKGTKLSFIGTFDVDSKGKLEIRLFKQNEITGMTLPQ